MMGRINLRGASVHRGLSVQSDQSLAHTANMAEQGWIFEPQYRLFNKTKNLSLAQSDLKLLRNEWNNILTETENQAGLLMMQNVFKKQPKIKSLFGVVNASDFSLERNPRIIKHSLVIQDTITMIMEALATTNEQLGSQISLFGSQHAYLTRRGFDPTYWNAFGDSMYELINITNHRHRRKSKRKKIQRIWFRFIRFIFASMQIGYSLGWQQHGGIEGMATHTLQTAANIDNDMLAALSRHASSASTVTDSMMTASSSYATYYQKRSGASTSRSKSSYLSAFADTFIGEREGQDAMAARRDKRLVSFQLSVPSAETWRVRSVSEMSSSRKTSPECNSAFTS